MPVVDPEQLGELSPVQVRCERLEPALGVGAADHPHQAAGEEVAQPVEEGGPVPRRGLDQRVGQVQVHPCSGPLALVEQPGTAVEEPEKPIRVLVASDDQVAVGPVLRGGPPP